MKLLWLDMEMTGLNPLVDKPIEIAVIVTDENLNCIEEYETVIYQEPTFIHLMDDWNIKHHSGSGLIDKIPNGKKMDVVEQELCDLIYKHFSIPAAKPILAGNSIPQDRLFIRSHFARIEDLLHYRMLDVSSWKVIFNSFYKLNYKKQNKHRALDDIKESIAELKFYVSHLDSSKIRHNTFI